MSKKNTRVPEEVLVGDGLLVGEEAVVGGEAPIGKEEPVNDKPPIRESHPNAKRRWVATSPWAVADRPCETRWWSLTRCLRRRGTGARKTAG